ncbi:MAG: hypothetical protein ABWX93_05745, partial [Pseudoxanthomonas sp.]
MTSSIGILLLLACAFTSAQAADTLRICTDDKPQLPYMTIDGGGLAGDLIRRAAAEQKLALTFHAAPIVRCRAELELGQADAFPMTPYTQSLLSLGAFPMRHGRVDPRRATMVARSTAYRLVGSRAGWDGRKFINLEGPVLVSSGAVFLIDRLRGMDVTFDDKGKGMEQVFMKLLAGRGSIAIGAGHLGHAQLKDPRFAGKIEPLPVQFFEQPYFLAVTRSYY